MRLTVSLAIVVAALGGAALPAAAAGPPAGPTLWTDVQVPGGIAAVAQALDLAVEPPPAQLVPMLVRLLYAVPDGSSQEVRARLDRLRAQTGEAALAADDGDAGTVVPLPLTPAIWSGLLGRDVSPANLFGAVVGDSRAALLAYGLAALDIQTLQYLASAPNVLKRLYAEDAAVFAGFSRTFRVRDGHVVAPGGDAARPSWEAVAGVPLEPADRFVEVLFHKDNGGLAYFFDAIASLDAPRQRYALGAWNPDARRRRDSFRRLYRNMTTSFRRWRPNDRPFGRVRADFALALRTVAAGESGAPGSPASTALWHRAFADDDLPAPESSDSLGLARSGPIDAANLVSLLLVGDPDARAERVATLAFGQRVFRDATPAQAADVLVALRARRRFPALVTAYERLGVTDPAAYAAAARTAERLNDTDLRAAGPALAGFEGALGLLVRLRQRHVLDTATAVRLAASLVALPINRRRGYDGGVARWIDEALLPALGATPDDRTPSESRLIDALAGSGAASEAALPRLIDWEGHPYRVDLVAAEADRLRRVRERQGGPSLDTALAVERIAHLDGHATIGEVSAAADALARAAADIPDEAVAAAAVLGLDPRSAVRVSAAGLAVVRGPADLTTVAAVVGPLVAAGDVLVGDVLASLAYAIALGSPDGRLLLGPNVAYQHDLGLGLPDRRAQRLIAWRAPAPDFSPGETWHVAGSLLGLDVALSPYGLRRVALDDELRAPVLNSGDRQTLVDTVALLDPFALTDAARATLLATLRAGRARVAAAAGDGASLDALAEEAHLDGWRRQELAWLARRGAGAVRIEAVFSQGELVWLGHPPSSLDLDQWGVSAIPLTGCLCTRFPAPEDWTSYAGRAGAGLITAELADLTLRVTEIAAQLKLPAALTPAVLSVATLEFVDRVQPAHEDDWRTLVTTARRLTRERVEDYTAALAVGGPLISDSGGSERGPRW